MTTLYSLKKQYPHALPFRIVLSNGTTRTDPLSFTQDELSDAGYVLVDNPPAYESLTEKLEWNGDTLTWTILPKSEQELEIDQMILAQSIREHRNRLLSESDWTQVLDSPVDRATWAEYRQSLRDITNQVTFPQEVLWPILPNNL